MTRTKSSGPSKKGRKSRKTITSSASMAGTGSFPSAATSAFQESTIGASNISHRDDMHHVAGDRDYSSAQSSSNEDDGSSILSTPPDSPRNTAQNALHAHHRQKFTAVESEISALQSQTVIEHGSPASQANALAGQVASNADENPKIKRENGIEIQEEDIEDVESLGGDDELSDGMEGIDGETDDGFGDLTAQVQEEIIQEKTQDNNGQNDAASPVNEARVSQDIADQVETWINAYVEGQMEVYEIERYAPTQIESDAPKVSDEVETPNSQPINETTPTNDGLMTGDNDIDQASQTEIPQIEVFEDVDVEDRDEVAAQGDSNEESKARVGSGVSEETDALLAAQLGMEEGGNLDENDDGSLKPDIERFSFKKLTDIETFKEYLSDTKSMSYEKLYHRTASVSDSLQDLQDEYDQIQRELNRYEARKRAKAKIAAEDAKVIKDKARKDEDTELLRLWAKFGEQIQGLKLVQWNEFKDTFAQAYPEEDGPSKLDLLLKLRNITFVNALIKRTQQQEGVPEEKPQLINTLPPALSAAELRAIEDEKARQKRKVTIDPVIFEDKKMADVYGFEYQSGEKYYGNQPLIDLNGLDPNNPDSRTTRTRGKRKFYESEANEETTGVSEEELPAKRKRVARVLDDGPGSPARSRQRTTQSRDGTPGPGPRVFASGKRVGRPPGSKTKSKLNAVVAAADVKQDAEEAPSIQAEPEPPKKVGRGKGQLLQPVQESQLVEAAELVVNGPPEGDLAILPFPPPKKKHAGGRPKGSGKKKAPIKREVTIEPVLASAPTQDPDPMDSEEILGPRGGKRKRGDTIAVVPPNEEDEESIPVPAQKRRKGSSANAQNVRKRKPASATSDSTIAVETFVEPSSPPVKRPRNTTKGKSRAKGSEEEGSVFEEDSGEDSGPAPRRLTVRTTKRHTTTPQSSQGTGPTPRRTGRERKLTGRALGLDGAADDDTESEGLRNQFRSKRARKTRVDLSFEESEDEEL